MEEQGVRVEVSFFFSGLKWAGKGKKIKLFCGIKVMGFYDSELFLGFSGVY